MTTALVLCIDGAPQHANHPAGKVTVSVVKSWIAADQDRRVALVTVAVLLGVGLLLGNSWAFWQVAGRIFRLTGADLFYGIDGVAHAVFVITWPSWNVTLTYGWTYVSLLPLLLTAVVAYWLVMTWLPWWSPTRRATFWTVWLASVSAGAVIGIGQLLWSVLMDYIDWPIWWLLLGPIGDLVFVAEGINWDALWHVAHATGWGLMAGLLAAALAVRTVTIR